MYDLYNLNGIKKSYFILGFILMPLAFFFVIGVIIGKTLRRIVQ